MGWYWEAGGVVLGGWWSGTGRLVGWYWEAGGAEPLSSRSTVALHYSSLKPELSVTH